MSSLERLGSLTMGIVKTQRPFESWKNSPVKDWDITIKMLTIGDLSDIAKLTENARPIQATYLNKIYLLAKCIVSIQGQPVVTEEDVENYNKDHNLAGNQQINLLSLKVIFINKWTEPVVNRLAYLYDDMQDEYLANHLGIILPDELRASSPLETAEPVEDKDKEHSDESDVSNYSI